MELPSVWSKYSHLEYVIFISTKRYSTNENNIHLIFRLSKHLARVVVYKQEEDRGDMAPEPEYEIEFEGGEPVLIRHFTRFFGTRIGDSRAAAVALEELAGGFGEATFQYIETKEWEGIPHHYEAKSVYDFNSDKVALSDYYQKVASGSYPSNWPPGATGDFVGYTSCSDENDEADDDEAERLEIEKMESEERMIQAAKAEWHQRIESQALADKKEGLLSCG